MFFHRYSTFGVLMLTLFSFLGISHTAQAAEVTLKADLGSSVIHTSERGRIYLRLSLRALVEDIKEKRTPVNVALVLDRSGSMQGDRIAAAKEAAQMALNRLSAEDVISVVAYNHGVETVQPAAHLADFDVLKRRIEALKASGRTALYAGVEEGARQTREFMSLDKVNRVILLSDGLANVGPSRPQDLADLGQKLGGDGISVTTIGLGLQYNEDLMSKLALASDGNHAFAETPENLVRIFNSEFGDVLSVAAQDIIIHIECQPGFKPKRIFGRKAKIDGNRISLKLNQLYHAQEKYLIVEVESDQTTNAGTADIADVKIDYLNLGNKQREQVNQALSVEFSDDIDRARTSVNKSVMTQVATQIANERNEQAVSLRDKGDIDGARKLLQDNAVYLEKKAKEYGASELSELEKANRTQAGKLSREDWAKTRKAMRHHQHRNKVQQSY